MKKPKVGNIGGLSTVISLKQIRPNHNPRSTIGIFTNIGSHLRSLMTIAGKCSCPCCGKLIAQGKKLNPAIFEKIYDPLFSLKPDKSTDSTKENATFPPSSMVKTYPEGTEKKVKDILTHCVSYLKDNTSYIYQPVLANLEKYGNIEGFRHETRPHGFGINYEWLVRCGLACRYGIPEKIPFLKQAEKLGYICICYFATGSSSYLHSSTLSIKP